MSWAARRRFFILLIIGAVVVAFLSVVLISTLSRAPSCSDGVQNQGEAGIDCGGPCAYLCTAQELPPTVLFTKTLQASSGRIDVIAEVENKNTNAAAKNVPYKIALYDANQKLIREVSGALDLPPGATTPVYVPGIASGKQMVTHAFLTLDPSLINWFAMPASARSVPTVSTITRSGTVDAPRIDAVLANPGVNSFDTVPTIIFVHGESGDIIAASQTIVRSIPAQGQATATFTWSTAFTSTSTAIEVLPIILLP
jgi:hypothetical protein